MFYAVSIATAVAYSAFQTAGSQGMGQCHQQSRACRPDWVAQRTCAAIDIEFFVVDPEITHRRHRNNRECFIDLVQIDILRCPAKFFL